MTFPLNPSVGQETSVAGKRYRWNGELWTRISAVVSANLVNSAAIIDNSVALVDLTSAVSSLILSKANISDLTSSNVTEGSNLFFTNARVYSNVIDIGFSTNAYVNSRLLTKANVSDLNTNNITEGSNLYFTNTRAISALTAGNGITIEANGLIVGAAQYGDQDAYANTILLDYATNTYVNARDLTKANVSDLTTTNVTELTNLYFTNSRVYANVIELGYATNTYLTNRLLTKANVSDLYTSNIIEGSNLYYTNARARAALSAGTGVAYNPQSGEISINQNVDITSNVTFQNLLVTGNLTVTGNTVTISATSLAIEDNMIYLNANSEVTNPDLGFAGNYNDGTYHHAGIFRDATDGVWKFYDGYQPEPDASPYIDTGHASFRLANIQATNVVANLTGRVSSIDNHTTSNLVEGDNLYFTNVRAVSALTAGIGISLESNGLITSTALGGVTSVNGANGNVLLYHTSDTPPSTSTLGSLWFNATDANLYVLINDGSGNVWLEITPSENYGVTAVFGQTQTVSNAQLACATISSGVLNTNNVVEGDNLYFTNTRAVSAFTAGQGITIAANGRITGASQYGDTDVYSNVNLIGFAANSYVNNRLLTKANIADLTTANVIELTNLYFTNTRAVGAFSSGSGIDIAANGRITSTAAGAATGGGSDAVFFLNDNVITANYTVPTGKNAVTGGPITINDNVVITVSDGSVWTIV
jgi:hypothetical protein